VKWLRRLAPIVSGRRLRADRRGLNPALGVGVLILVTLLIAVGVGAMVLGVAGGVGEGPPEVEFALSTSNVADSVEDNDQIALRHDGGGRFVTSTVSIRAGGTPVYRNGTVVADPDEDGTGDVFGEGDVVEVVWHGADGRESIARLQI